MVDLTSTEEAKIFVKAYLNTCNHLATDLDEDDFLGTVVTDRSASLHLLVDNFPG